MKGRKRAPGGGRKPKGEFSNLAANITIRMPNDMRQQLEVAAKKSNRSLAQEMLSRLRLSFSRDMEKGRDPAMRALNFLIGEVAHQVVGLPVIEDDGRETMLIDWRSDPFVYRAFKLAVQQLLETLTPPGKIESHAASKALAKKMLAGGLESPPFVITLASSAAHDPVTKRFVESWKTPEARAEYAVGWVLDSLRTARSGPDREEARKFAERVNSPSAWREFYGMPDAARDLQPNQPPRRGK